MLKDTKVPNMAYITFIDGIILTPVAEKMNVREAWMFMVIYRHMKQLHEPILDSKSSKIKEERNNHQCKYVFSY